MKIWYYVDGQGNQHGPVNERELVGKGVTKETYVWSAGMEKWKQVKNIPDLQKLFFSQTKPYGAGVIPYKQSLQQSYQQQEVSHPLPAVQESPKPASPVKPANFLVWSILSTICCCVPIGIYAIYCSAQVDSSYKSGRYTEAATWSAKAKKWAIVGAVCGAVVSVLYGIAYYVSNL